MAAIFLYKPCYGPQKFEHECVKGTSVRSCKSDHAKIYQWRCCGTFLKDHIACRLSCVSTISSFPVSLHPMDGGSFYSPSDSKTPFSDLLLAVFNVRLTLHCFSRAQVNPLYQVHSRGVYLVPIWLQLGQVGCIR